MSNSVFVKVSVKDELPPKQAFYNCFRNNDNVFMGQSWWDGDRFPFSDITHWLKKVEMPDEVSIKLSVAGSNPFEEQHSLVFNAWNMGLIRGITAVLNLLTPNKDDK